MRDVYIKFVRHILNFFDFFFQKKIINFFKRKFDGKKIIFFDVGSHYGETIYLFSKYLDIQKFHCFEASPLNFNTLKKKLQNHRCRDICTLNNLGVGRKNYETVLNQTKESSSSTINNLNLNSNYFLRKLRILNISNVESYSEKIPIKIISLDYYIRKNNVKFVDIVKIDTEGFEFEVLKGLEENIQKVKFIYFEHHYDNMIVKNYTFSDIHSFLKNSGFFKKFKSKMPFRKSFEYIYQNSKN